MRIFSHGVHKTKVKGTLTMRVRMRECTCFGDRIFKDDEDGTRIEIDREIKSVNFVILKCFIEHVQL